jgi:hypothetical protein
VQSVLFYFFLKLKIRNMSEAIISLTFHAFLFICQEKKLLTNKKRRKICNKVHQPKYLQVVIYTKIGPNNIKSYRTDNKVLRRINYKRLFTLFSQCREILNLAHLHVSHDLVVGVLHQNVNRRRRSV